MIILQIGIVIWTIASLPIGILVGLMCARGR